MPDPAPVDTNNQKGKKGTNGSETQELQSVGNGDGGAMAALGELICRLNPYTRLKDANTGEETGDMEVGMLPPASQVYNPGDPNSTIACMGIEAERNYNATWTFKGQTQNVKAAFRIPYRFQVKNGAGAVKYWQTEYLLIGYAGGDGPG